MSETKTPSFKLTVLDLNSIHPYPQNPRVITDEDVERVASSIEQYGYQAPIMVDAEHVIIVGHTRHRALIKLGFVQAAVIVADLPLEKAREYRVVDNRAGELTTWDRDLLIPELREFTTTEHLEMFFPEIDLSFDFSDDNFTISDKDLDKARAELDKRLQDQRGIKVRTIECPSCHEGFEVSG